MSLIRKLLGRSEQETGRGGRRGSHVTPSRTQPPAARPEAPEPEPPEPADAAESQAAPSDEVASDAPDQVDAPATPPEPPEAPAPPQPEEDAPSASEAADHEPAEPAPEPARQRPRPPSPKPILTRQRQPLSYGIASDVGLLRSNNEDACFGMQWHSITVDSRPDFGFFVVADGMGGHLDGERAAGTAVQTMAAEMLDKIYVPLLRNFSAGDSPTVLEALVAAAERANLAVIKAVPGGGTTLTAIAIIGNLAYIAHVGDSRAYLVHDGKIEQLTTDHTLVQRLIEMNELTPEEALSYPQKNVLYRAIGQNENLKVERLARTLPPSSLILLCTDGLWDMLDDEMIRVVAQDAASPQEACQQLVSLANDRGGVDNISVIALMVPGGGAD